MLTKTTLCVCVCVCVCVCEYDHPSHYLVNLICASIASLSLLYSTQLQQFEDHDTLWGAKRFQEKANKQNET